MVVDAKVSEYLLELLRCGVNNTIPSAKPEEVSWEAVYALAKRHSVSALAFYALRTRKDELPAALAEKWEEQNAMLLTKYVNQEHESSQLCSMFEQEQIPYMPLKGSCIRDLYPEPYLREMSDLDIMVQEKDITAASSIAQTMGYSVGSGANYHVELLKKPYMCLELHLNLVPTDSPFFKYYSQPWKFARATGMSYRRVMTKEDYYVYMLAHTAKHYYWTGTGIRSLLDAFLFNRAYRTELDLDYVAAQLEELKIVDFSEQIEALTELWFSVNPQCNRISCDTAEMRCYILNSSTYGTAKNYDQNVVRGYISNGKSLRGAKLAMYMHMTFLPLCEMKGMYPILKKVPVLLPFCWVVRWFRILIRKPSSITAQYRRISEIELYTNAETEQK